MKIKLLDILNISDVIKKIIDDNTLNIDSLFKFKLLGILKEIEISVTNFDIIRNDKIKEYGEEITDENGNVLSIAINKDDKESLKKFSEDMDKIVNSDVTINIQKLKSSDVFNKGVPAEYLITLYPIIEE